LPGITRASVIQLLRHWGMNVSERRISMQELYDAYQAKTLKEAFGSGTAAVISPIGKLDWNGRSIEISQGEIGEVSQRVYDTLTGIQTGVIDDTFNWVVEVKSNI